MSNDVSSYPSRESMMQRWADLTREITSASYGTGVEAPKGELVVLGSGISHVDFTADAKAEIMSADYVFYCLYDRVTQIWLSTIRPDAYDLYVLYDDETKRYFTYVQMAEAMLHYVRQGKKVVAIYYGHPGVFATPTHRAIQIARREGHVARMRPGISALDYLIAEVGFDPAIPGMVNYEASDMLLRKRKIDQSLHVVVWQVGLVGDFGFRRAGFINDGFRCLVDVLVRAYGSEWKLTHYIASRFVGVEPLIEEIPIGSLNNPEIRSEVSALSTFYIPPSLAVPTDMEMAKELQLVGPGEAAPPPLRAPDMSRYGAAEVEAISNLRQFKPPAEYTIPKRGPEAEFVLALTEDIDLQEEYRKNPESVLTGERYPAMTERARKLLSIPHPMAIERSLYEAQ